MYIEVPEYLIPTLRHFKIILGLFWGSSVSVRFEFENY